MRLEDAGRGEEPLGPLIDEMFRHAHSLKGMSAAMELDGIKEVAHRAESLLEVFRRTVTAPDPGSMDVLLGAVDAMQAMVDRAAQGEQPPAEAALLDRLGAAVGRAQAAAAGEKAAPASPAAAPAAAEAPAMPG
ncbi:MAG TPA: Hpt domain-containing protein, partial [Anaeromyxobacteraceae bacterium]|nr:Hpt domain-containing protein [Anaeromyxobacteraceae bacterium]